MQEETDKLRNQIQARKEEIRSILEEAPVLDTAAKYEARYVGSKWLQDWADTLERPALDNGPLLCTHNKLDPQKLKGTPTERKQAAASNSFDTDQQLDLPETTA